MFSIYVIRVLKLVQLPNEICFVYRSAGIVVGIESLSSVLALDCVNFSASIGKKKSGRWDVILTVPGRLRAEKRTVNIVYLVCYD